MCVRGSVVPEWPCIHVCTMGRRAAVSEGQEAERSLAAREWSRSKQSFGPLFCRIIQNLATSSGSRWSCQHREEEDGLETGREHAGPVLEDRRWLSNTSWHRRTSNMSTKDSYVVVHCKMRFHVKLYPSEKHMVIFYMHVNVSDSFYFREKSKTTDQSLRGGLSKCLLNWGQKSCQNTISHVSKMTEMHCPC